MKPCLKYDSSMESKIRDYLLEKQAVNGWKQDEMAGVIGVPKGTLSRWLHGTVLPDYDSMRKIADGLQVPMQEVLDARDGKYKPMSKAKREGVEITKKYDPESVKEAFRAMVGQEDFDFFMNAIDQFGPDVIREMVEEKLRQKEVVKKQKKG